MTDEVGSAAFRASDGLGLLRAATFVLRNGRLVAWTSFAFALLGLIVALGAPRLYVATAAFTPSSPPGRGQAGSLGGLASQLGVQLDVGAGDPLDFYAALATSRALLTRVAADTYVVATRRGGREIGDLQSLYGIRGDGDMPGSVRRTVEQLRRHVTVQFDPQTTIVQVRVEATTPSLAEQITERILWHVNDFYLQRRQIQAASERLFIESRIIVAESVLVARESDLASFLKRNRVYADSPELVLEHDRLARRVELQQQVLTSLAQGSERARIEEVRSTSAVIPVDQPRGSASPKPRGLTVKVLLGLFFGGLLGIVLAAARRTLQAEREMNPRAYAEFQAVAVSAMHNVKALVTHRREPGA